MKWLNIPNKKYDDLEEPTKFFIMIGLILSFWILQPITHIPFMLPLCLLTLYRIVYFIMPKQEESE